MFGCLAKIVALTLDYPDSAVGLLTILIKALRCMNVQQCDEKDARAVPCTHELHPSLELQICRGKLTVKADTMTDLPTLANQSEGPQLFTCPICLDECPRLEIFVPSGCSHEFCRECARSVVLSAVRWVYHLPAMQAGYHAQPGGNQTLHHVAYPHNIILTRSDFFVQHHKFVFTHFLLLPCTCILAAV